MMRSDCSSSTVHIYRPPNPNACCAGDTIGSESSGEAACVGTAVASGGCADWWLGAIDLLVRSSPSQGDNVADHIKEQLMERDRSAYVSSALHLCQKMQKVLTCPATAVPVARLCQRSSVSVAAVCQGFVRGLVNVLAAVSRAALCKLMQSSDRADMVGVGNGCTLAAPGPLHKPCPIMYPSHHVGRSGH